MTEPTLLPIEQESGTPQTAVAGPGKRLREARQAQHLSVAKAAALLHLDPRLVDALEHNDYEHLPEPIYVTGYLRNYARLLDLPEEGVVSAYQQLDIPPPPILSDLTRKTRRSAPLNHVLIQWGAVGAVAIALVLVTWHMSTQRRAPAGAGGPVSAEASAPPSAAAPAPSAGTPSPADGHAAAAGIAPPESADAAPAPESGAAAPEVQAATRPPPVAGAGPADAVPPPARAAGSPAGTAAVQTAAADGATVVLQFSHDSWVEMTDATGRRVFVDLGKAGQTRTVHGTPPFKVLLGYSPGVSIDYNGKPFDQSSFTGHNNVAHFTMGTDH